MPSTLRTPAMVLISIGKKAPILIKKMPADSPGRTTASLMEYMQLAEWGEETELKGSLGHCQFYWNPPIILMVEQEEHRLENQ